MQIVQKQKELRGEAEKMCQDIEEVHNGRDKGLSYLFHNLFDRALNELCLELQQQSISKLNKHTQNSDHCFPFEAAHNDTVQVFVCVLCLSFQAEQP